MTSTLLHRTQDTKRARAANLLCAFPEASAWATPLAIPSVSSIPSIAGSVPRRFTRSAKQAGSVRSTCCASQGTTGSNDARRRRCQCRSGVVLARNDGAQSHGDGAAGAPAGTGWRCRRP